MSPDTFFNGLRRALPMLICPWLLACGTSNQAHRPSAEKAQETAKFYWKYAALAANVYNTAGRVDTQFSTMATSSWIRDEIRESKDQAAQDEFEKRLQSDKERMYRTYINNPVAEPSDLSAADNFDKEVPSESKQCNYDGKHQPAVPIAMAVNEFGWDPVFELHRQLHPRGWSVFVPGLAIDVWRRKSDPVGESPVVEYAFVYRGTAGTGGWFSNFRALTAFTPAVWDQYKQAEIASKDLISQIDKLHERSDELFKREAPTRVRVTAVGHSLGGGLAKYVFMRIPQVTKVVAFDPSPVDGSSHFTPFEFSDHKKAKGLMERQMVLDARRRPLDRDDRSSDTSIFVLYEEGSAMTTFAGCASGPIWGSEGGPVVRCESLNLSRGNMFRQHNMAQLACKLYLAKNGQST